MPIIFPKGMVEKIVEKVVEKVKYVAVSMVSGIGIAHAYITDAVAPSVVNVIARTITGILLRCYAFRLSLPKLLFRVISTPAKPVAGFIIGVTQLIIGREVRDAIKFYVTHQLVSNPLKPAVSFIFGITQPYLQVKEMDAKKPYLSLRLVSNPPKPSPVSVNSFSTAVGVKISP